MTTPEQDAIIQEESDRGMRLCLKSLKEFIPLQVLRMSEEKVSKCFGHAIRTCIDRLRLDGLLVFLILLCAGCRTNGYPFNGYPQWIWEPRVHSMTEAEWEQELIRYGP